MKEDAEVHPHELIAALIDGIVTPAEREAVQAHLKLCKPCRALLGDLQRLSAAPASDSVPPPPSDPAARIRWRLQSLEANQGQAPPRPAHRRWLGPLPVSAAAGLVLAFVALWALRDEVVEDRDGAGVAMEPAPILEPPLAQAPPLDETPTLGEAPVPGEAPPPAQAPAAPSAPGPSGGARLATEKVEPAPPAAKTGAGNLVQETQRPAAAAERGAAGADDEPRKVFDPATGVTGAAAPPRVGRWLSLELPDLRIEVDEGGALSVDADRYACAVQLQPAEVAPLFRLASGSELGTLGDLAVAPEGIDPALAQRGRRVLTRTGGKAEGFQAIEYLDLPERPAPPLLHEIEAQLLQLVRSDARERLEKACGPLTAP